MELLGFTGFVDKGDRPFIPLQCNLRTNQLLPYTRKCYDNPYKVLSYLCWLSVVDYKGDAWNPI